jgi:iron(III) transport system substrate-binding protein
VQAQEKTTLVIYTVIVADELPLAEQLFESKHPTIDLVMKFESSGITAARIRAERDNPQADVVWGLAATIVMGFAKDGMLEPYKPAGVELVEPRFVDKNDPPNWVGIGAWSSLPCYNTIEGEAKGVPQPKAWADLLDPIYAGQVAMPNPSTSATGLLTVTGWMQMMGEAKAWEYMDQLDKNIVQYTSGASKPCKDAAAGEYVVGISVDAIGAREKMNGAPIELPSMSEGVGWELDVVAILKGTQELDAAKAFVDWAMTDEAMEIYARGYTIASVPGIGKPLPTLPTGIADRFVDVDFAWIAENRDRILAEWMRRYGDR